VVRSVLNSKSTRPLFLHGRRTVLSLTMDLTTSTPLNSFPPLKMSDILDCMRELGMELTKQELLEPSRNKERVRQIYIYLVSTSCPRSFPNTC